MPVYRFRGIDVFGKIHKGRLSAPTKEYLRQNLVLRGIVLLKAKPMISFAFLRKISTKEIILFYQTLSQLLQSGVLLPDALLYIAQNSSHAFFQDTVYILAQKVISGTTFSEAIAANRYFGQKTISFLIQAGQQSGNLQQACQTITDYLRWKETTKKTILSFLVMPLLTLGAIITILCIISHFMLPRIIDMFRLLEQHKATMLQNNLIFKVISFFSLSFFAVATASFILLSLLLWITYKTRWGNRFLLEMVLKIPYIKTLYLDFALNRLFFTLALLLKNGTNTAQSLSIIAQFTPQIPLQKKTEALALYVKEGMVLSQALVQVFTLHDPYAVLVLRVAENTGSVPQACQHIADYYTQELQRKVGKLLFLLQPLLILFLGIVIAALMIGLYAPITQLSLNL